MKITILTLTMRSERDAVVARQRAGQIADHLGFGIQEQARIATAVFEIAYNALRYAGGGQVDYLLKETVPAQAFMIWISDHGPGITDLPAILDRQEESGTDHEAGILRARRLVDHFHIVSPPGEGTTVFLGKNLPKAAPRITLERLTEIAGEMAHQLPRTPVDAVRRQNRELFRALDDLRAREQDLRRLGEELEETNRGVVALHAELDRAIRARDEVLSIVSHDLRDPVSTISMSTALLLEMELPEERRIEQFRIIQRSAERMNRLIQDLLDVGRIEAGRFSIDPHRQEAAPLVREACELFRQHVEKKALRLECEVADDLPQLDADRDRILQVLSNLIGNAIKFTNEGGRIAVRASPGGEEVEFSVSDTGSGIAAEDLPHLFDARWQAGRTAHMGAGLGLAIAKGIAEAHGGKIWAESTVGEGSTFSFIIPTAQPEAELATAP